MQAKLSSVPTWVLLALIGQVNAMTGVPLEVEVGIPPDLSDRPASATCAALRSGTYRMISPTLGGTLTDQTGKMSLEAPTLAVARPDGSRGTWIAEGDCRFTDSSADGYRIDYVVSQAGILAGRVSVNGGSSYRVVFGFPQQTHAMAELAGTWNTMALRGPPDSFYAGTGSLTFDAAGAVIAATECANPETWSTSVCVDVSKVDIQTIKGYAADPGGGFVGKQSGRTSRLFIYRAASGEPMMVEIGSDGAFFFGAPAKAMAMPPVGSSKVRWNFDLTARLASVTNAYTTVGTEVSVDFADGSWMRKKKGATLADEHFEKLFANRPRNGYSTRPPGEAPTSDGRVVRFNELTALALPGTGIQPVIIPRVKLFEIVVIAP